jgi:hypothetical protein
VRPNAEHITPQGRTWPISKLVDARATISPDSKNLNVLVRRVCNQYKPDEGG